MNKQFSDQKRNNTRASNHIQRKNYVRKMFLLLLTLSLFLGLFSNPGSTAPVSAQSDRKQVLYINSYHQGYKFSDDILRAITTVFKEEGNIDLRIEYLDTKRISDAEYLQEVAKLFSYKYKNAKIDLIISSDDTALNFLFANADTLFPDVPVVFVGANYFDITRLQGHPQFTGISEEADIPGTLDAALRLQPGVRNVVVINDTTVTGQNVHKAFDAVMPNYPQINFRFLEDVTMDDIRQQISVLSKDTLVLLTIFSKDKAGNFFEYDQYTSLIASSSSVPVFGTWDFSLGYGIVGGKLTSGYTEGERGARLAIRILNGETPSLIPVEKQVKSQLLFDYAVMEKWGISTSLLPEGSVMINKPVSFYEENALAIWLVIAGFAILILVIVFLTINNRRRRAAQEELAVANRELQAVQINLEQRVAARTEDLATVADVGTATSTILDIDRLLQSVVDLTKERFYNLYHSHIYLLDEAGENLVLAAGAGEPGRVMVAEKRSIPLNREQSLVARAAREQKGVIVNDVTLAPDFLPNPLLPNTRSELAVPMIVGGNVIGVFDVQSDQVDRFSDADINIQTTLASQVAASIQNARLYARSKAQADVEALASSIAQKIQRTTSVEETLQTAIREVGLALGAARVSAGISAKQQNESAETH